jgi:hypothetical protein
MQLSAKSGVADLHQGDADAYPDPTFHNDVDADPDPTFQFDADPIPADHFFPELYHLMLQNDPLKRPPFHFNADPDPQHWPRDS